MQALNASSWARFSRKEWVQFRSKREDMTRRNGTWQWKEKLAHLGSGFDNAWQRSSDVARSERENVV